MASVRQRPVMHAPLPERPGVVRQQRAALSAAAGRDQSCGRWRAASLHARASHVADPPIGPTGVGARGQLRQHVSRACLRREETLVTKSTQGRCAIRRGAAA